MGRGWERVGLLLAWSGFAGIVVGYFKSVVYGG